MAWCGAQGRAAAGWHISLPSHHFKIESSYTNLYGFLLWPLFLLSILHACLFLFLVCLFFPSSFCIQQWERERERDSHKSHDPLLLFSPLLSLLLSFSSSSPFPLRILKLSIADSAPREARLRLQRLLHSAWATIPIWITFTTVGVEVPQCVFRDL